MDKLLKLPWPYVAIGLIVLICGVAGNVIGQQIAADAVEPGDWLAFVGALLGAGLTVIGAYRVSAMQARGSRQEADAALIYLARQMLVDLKAVQTYRKGHHFEKFDEDDLRQGTAFGLQRLAAAPALVRDTNLLSRVSKIKAALYAGHALDQLQNCAEHLRTNAVRVHAHDDEYNRVAIIWIGDDVFDPLEQAIEETLIAAGGDPEKALAHLSLRGALGTPAQD